MGVRGYLSIFISQQVNTLEIISKAAVVGAIAGADDWSFIGMRYVVIHSHPRKLTLPLKNGACKTILSFWNGPFLRDMLILGRYTPYN